MTTKSRSNNAVSRPSRRAPKPAKSVDQQSVESEMSKKSSFDKEKKLLSKHSAALEHAEMAFNAHVISSIEHLPKAVAELTACLNRRGEELKSDLDKLRASGKEFFQSRRKEIEKLKMQLKQMNAPSEADLTKLRGDLKALDKDGRLESELCRVVPFEWEADKLLKSVGQFGCVNNLLKGHEKTTGLPLKMDIFHNGPCGQDAGSKPVSKINLGAITMESEHLDAKELLHLSKQVQDMLRIQGIADDVLPNICSDSRLPPVHPSPIRTRRQRAVARGGARGSARGNAQRGAKT